MLPRSREAPCHLTPPSKTCPLSPCVFLESGAVTLIFATNWCLFLFFSERFYLHSLLFLTATLGSERAYPRDGEGGSEARSSIVICRDHGEVQVQRWDRSQLPWWQTRALDTAPCCLVQRAQTLLVGTDRELVSQMSQVERLSTCLGRLGN